MKEKYDSILKEKKKYKEVIDDRVFLRRHSLSINFFAILIILIVSFIIYFTTVLSPSNLILGDIDDFMEYTSIIYKNIKIDYDFNNQYNFFGDVSLEVDSNYDNVEDMNFLRDLKFNYSYISNNFYKLLDINSDNYAYTYYEDGKQGYFSNSNNNIIYSNIDNSILDIDKYKFNYINSLSKELENITYKRNVSVDNGKLIVAVNFKLTGRELKDILSKISIFDNIKDTATYEFTIKNDVFLNDLLSFKLVIRDNDYRGVLTYQDNTFEYRDDNHNYKGVLKIEEEDFSFRFYEEDDMKYILTGKGNDNSYVYTYQVINVVDKISIQIKKDNLENIYTINIKKENNDKYLNILSTINLKYNNNINYDNKEILSKEYKLYSDLSDIEKQDVDNYINKIYNSLNNLFNYLHN